MIWHYAGEENAKMLKKKQNWQGKATYAKYSLNEGCANEMQDKCLMVALL